MTSRTQELDILMREHDLTARQVGEMLGRTPHTVRVWRSKYEQRVIPEHTLAFLRMKIAERARGVE
ncbi:helix-turn-helix domain-containing protein [Bradyrhizobium yuanmingense]|uniref:helix-turn-helix domain-containing protein n=1 Tax=Bradyrhizobium yuanmingense TaxID=108015 RepID=UPI0004B55AFC|nr:helix-turn-helix domain-containing protein [Bradyrhizobium yuanmingense]